MGCGVSLNNHDLTDVSIIKITIWRDSSVGVVVRSRKGMVIVTYDNDGIIIETPTLKYRVVPNDHSKTGDIAKLENRIKWARETFDEL